MKLSELIARHGDDDVLFQKLDDCVSTMSLAKHGSKVSFVTPERFDTDGFHKLGLIVWLDRKKAAAAVAEASSPSQQEGPQSGSGGDVPRGNEVRAEGLVRPDWHGKADTFGSWFWNAKTGLWQSHVPEPLEAAAPQPPAPVAPAAGVEIAKVERLVAEYGMACWDRAGAPTSDAQPASYRHLMVAIRRLAAQERARAIEEAWQRVVQIRDGYNEAGHTDDGDLYAEMIAKSAAANEILKALNALAATTATPEADASKAQATRTGANAKCSELTPNSSDLTPHITSPGQAQAVPETAAGGRPSLQIIMGWAKGLQKSLRERLALHQLHDLAKALDAAVPGLAEANGWQDISTAPKDGTEVLLFSVPNEFPAMKPHIGTGYFKKTDGLMKPGLWIGRHPAGPSFTPTHWRPLPADPSPRPTKTEPRQDGGREVEA